jgi:hypothetical protein
MDNRAMSQQTHAQPNLTELLAGFLNRQAQAGAEGLASLGPGAEVTPYEAGPVQPIDAKLAWEEAVVAASYFLPGVDATSWAAPPHWVNIVSEQEPAVALAFCLGNFPQLVRDFQGIVHKVNPGTFQPSPGRPMHVPALVDWAREAAARKQLPRVLTSLGALRLARNFDKAEAYIEANTPVMPREWRDAWNNEKAALAWDQGHADAAMAIWNTMEPKLPVLFNRGMAELFRGDAAAGRAALSEAALKLPENSAWHHLARLYILLGTTPSTAHSAAE